MGASQQPWDIGQSGDGWSVWSAQSLLLPYLEQNPIYNAINFNWGPGSRSGGTAYAAKANATAYNTRINSFLCPSDGNAGKVNINSYCASMGATTYNVNQRTSGVFAYQTCYSIADITDGTSSTIAFSEALVGEESNAILKMGNSTGNAAGGGQAVNQYVLVASMLPQVKQDLQTCTGWYMSGMVTGGRGTRWGWGSIGASLFNTVVPPNGAGTLKWGACRMDCCVNAIHDHYTNATSNHSGGCNVAMADGSVHFIKSTIAFPTWWALGTRATGETISSDQY